MWGEWGEGRYNIEPTQRPSPHSPHISRHPQTCVTIIDFCVIFNIELVQYCNVLPPTPPPPPHISRHPQTCVTIIDFCVILNIELVQFCNVLPPTLPTSPVTPDLCNNHRFLCDDCYTGLGVTGYVGGGGGGWGKDVTILNQLNIEYHTEIDDCYTGLG